MQNLDAAGSPDWHDGLAALRRYVEVRHTAAPPTSARVEGFALGEWVRQLRSCYWAGTLEPDRVELLQALPGWRWSGTHERRWRARLDALRRYAARNGTCAVPPDLVVGCRMRLGQWVAAQKASQTAGRLPRPVAELLEQVPGWEWEKQSQPEEETTRWTIVLDALRRGCGATGANQVSDRASVEEFPLNQWIRRLRDDFRDDTLPPEIVAQLETLPGWSWNPRQTSWERGLYALRAWVSVHGDACPPQAGVIDGFPIGRWVHARRREHRAAKLPPEKSSQLEALPGWQWNIYDVSWQRAVQALQAYAAEHGTTRVPSGHTVGNLRLGEWVGHQRRLHRRGQLAAGRVAQLEDLPGWRWDGRGSVEPP
jgi:hypothetical protein